MAERKVGKRGEARKEKKIGTRLGEGGARTKKKIGRRMERSKKGKEKWNKIGRG